MDSIQFTVPLPTVSEETVEVLVLDDPLIEVEVIDDH